MKSKNSACANFLAVGYVAPLVLTGQDHVTIVNIEKKMSLTFIAVSTVYK